MKTALFPGSFDPITIAHVDIVRRSLPLFDKIIVGIGLNSAKQSFLQAGLREQVVKAVFKNEPKIEVQTYEGLTVDFAKHCGAGYMIRGIRSVSDFEYERPISQVNQMMEPSIETIFIFSRPEYGAISSTIVRDILRNKGNVAQFVPKEALEFLK